MKAIVTGAASGLGRATAERLVDRGDVVVRVDRNNTMPEPCELCDVADAESVHKAIHRARDRLGGLDAVVHCAAINHARKGFAELSVEDWDRVVAVNLLGAVHVARACLEPLRASRGSVVLVGSVEAYAASENFSAYCVSKAGLAMFARCLAVDEPELRVTLLSPDGMDTPLIKSRQTPEERQDLMQPEHVADLILAAIGHPTDGAVAEIVVRRRRATGGS